MIMKIVLHGFKNISKWYTQGLISKQESINAHSYLVERGTISQN